MNKTQILGVCTKLTQKSFLRSDSVKHRLLENLFHLRCAEFGIDQLVDVNFNRLVPWTDGAQIYEFANTTSITTCHSPIDVEFHVKRIVSDIAVSLDRAYNLLWECVTSTYSSDPSLNRVGDLPGKIDQICSSGSDLQLIKFTKDHFQRPELHRKMINHIRTEYSHNRFSLRNDLSQRLPDDGYSEYGDAIWELIVDYTESTPTTLSQAQRKYKSFFPTAYKVVADACSAFLLALDADIEGTEEVPIRFDSEIPSESD